MYTGSKDVIEDLKEMGNKTWRRMVQDRKEWAEIVWQALQK